MSVSNDLELLNLQKELEFVKKELDDALRILKTFCKACAYYGSLHEPCESCWLETYPGHPEKTKRTHWKWRGEYKWDVK